MKAWLVESIADGAMRLADRPTPTPGPGETLIRVEVAGVNFLDTLMRHGRYQKKPPLPFTPGVEIVGATPDGSRVYAPLETGAFAEYAAARTDALRPIPDDIPPAAALTLFGVNYGTSHYALHERASLRPGDTVLVHAAAGGVGSAAVQLARAAGARVVATAGGPAKCATARALGADLTVDYDQPDWFETARAALPDGADIVYDPVGGDIAEQSLRLLAWHGRYLVIGFAVGTIPALPANRLLLKEAAAVGVFWGEATRRDPALAARTTDALLALWRDRRLAPHIGATYPLAQADQALADLANRQSTGKLVIQVTPAAPAAPTRRA